MDVVETVSGAKCLARTWRRAGESIGLVPTMGFLHEGHASLIRRARAENDRVVVSVFVNPTQFAAGEDLATYPRDFAADAALCERLGVDAVFHPEPDEMYRDAQTRVEQDMLTATMEGASRPSHFSGVCTVVAKLFNIVDPTRAYFGQKDAQQLAVVKKMAADLDFDVQVVGCPTVRETDGLAKSSRNAYLSAGERDAATVLARALEAGRAIVHPGMASAELVAAMREVLAAEPLAEVDYIAVADAVTMQPVERVEGEVLVALAVRIGATRLIDNFTYAPGVNRRGERS